MRARANDFLKAANQITVEEAAGTPLPGETLASFYERTREHWVQQAFVKSNNRGKELRRDGFALAEERYSASVLIVSPKTLELNLFKICRCLQTYSPGGREDPRRSWIGR